ncbi:efflux RND transporter periplasmic adaptor subunit [Teichococcus vastitatis]|jgi:membrane fusion protein (multidrug efflux system)|uniref:Efflux RND transporter periplasmic adaptor subunit n=1 Tax=Teichococcus vastitatis TaxID=2307076 RepID=A0ABS9W0V1_9PROT|nr:efflux RND transporter periplasmic adaptor subunit [Pseudoroseomonas vastitatis]MCI0752926.1 efflux RND transporter periplasmic adaptor subunit [Pseudoroseomonas vastitatis]
MTLLFRRGLPAIGLALLALPAMAAQPPGGGAPPAVGVAPVARRAVTESNEFIGRIEAINRVEIVSRVTAFLEKREFTEGSEVKQGDLLIRLERGPFEAQLAQARAAVAEADAQLQNASVTLNRAQALLNTVAGQRSNVDTALAAQRSAQAQLLSAQAQQRQAQINLDYTEIRAPIDGRIGRALVTEGNVVSPSSGTLVSIVSQDPMYVLFTVPVRTLLEVRSRYAGRGGINAVAVKVRLPDGTLYDQSGKLDFVDIDVGQDTDSITLRARMPNPVQDGSLRGLSAGQLVSVVVEAIEPAQLLTVPRGAVITDQRGDFVYVVGADNKAERRSIRMGSQSTPELAVVQEGLREGDQVIVDGLQRVRPGSPVSPAPVQGGAAGQGPGGPGRPAQGG